MCRHLHFSFSDSVCVSLVFCHHLRARAAIAKAPAAMLHSSSSTLDPQSGGTAELLLLLLLASSCSKPWELLQSKANQKYFYVYK
jgi:hypothetical protein